MSKPMISPGSSVERNIRKFQLERIIELAKAGKYGARSGQVLKDSRRKLKEMGVSQ